MACDGLMTVRPGWFVLSSSQAKNRMTRRVMKFPTIAKALDTALENPRDITMLGMYVVSGLPVAKTQAVLRKCGHYWTLANAFHTTVRGIPWR